MSAGAVVVTASAGSFPGLSEALGPLAAVVEEHPLVVFGPPLDWAPVDEAIRHLSGYGAVALTSPRAAAAFGERVALQGTGTPQPMRPMLWAAGAATAAALGKGLGPVRTPSDRDTGELGAAAALARAMLAAGVRGPALYPCGEVHRDELPTELRAAGLRVDEVVCYRTVLASEAAARQAAERARVLVVASPSVVELLARACPQSMRPPLLAIGPTTAAAARAAGWPPAAVADRPVVAALGGCIRALLAEGRPE